jgi:hypothetical protein
VLLAHSSATRSYLNSSVAPYLPSQMLRPIEFSLLAVPRSLFLAGFCQGTDIDTAKVLLILSISIFDINNPAFCVAVPTVFNSHTQDIRLTGNMSMFRRLSKTVLFPLCLRLTLMLYLFLRFNIFC